MGARGAMVCLLVAAACSDGAGAPVDAGGTNGTNGTSGTGSAGTAAAAGGSRAGTATAAGGSGGSSPSRSGSGGASTPDAGAADSGHAGASGAGAGGAASDAMIAMPQDAAPASEAGAPDAGSSPAACGRCNAYAAPTQTGTVEPTELNALSGLAVSRAQPEILFAHNDHDRAEVYALDLQGQLHARISLEGATATDIEDIAIGPCAAESCIYLADVGDNAAQRGEYAILRIAEPTVPTTPGNTALTSDFERYRFSYEDGSHNAESLMVSPDGSLYLITKLAPGTGGRVGATGPSTVYKLTPPLSSSAVARASKVATLPVPSGADQAASAAAAHPCGQGFLLRTYNRVYEFQTPEGGAFEAAFQATPKVVAMPDEPQSEGIDYYPNGKGFITSGEGSHAPIVSTACAP